MPSPRNLDSNAAEQATIPENPLLASPSSSLPTRLFRSRRRHNPLVSDGKSAPLSAPLPLPKSHIRRTPSELQLADDLRRAEYEDVRMYARLVVGMQSQCLATGFVHPLTRKSLQDILRTKQADGEELERSSNKDDDEDDWELGDVEESRDGDSVGTPSPCQPLATAAGAPSVVKTPSEVSLASNLSGGLAEGQREDPQDSQDECVFSLEL